MKLTQLVMHEAAPSGAVTVYFRETGLTSLRFNLGGPNEGWWWEGGKISRDRAERLLEEYTIRAVTKSPGNWPVPSALSRAMQG